jgi:hypothetical protein
MEHHMHAFSQYPQQGMGAMPMSQHYGPGMGQGQYAPAMGYPGYPVYGPYYQQQRSNSLFNDRFLKGLLIGAAAAYLLTNENVQRTAIKGAVKAWSLLQGGVEEMKERFQDAAAEIRTEAGE